MATDANGPTGQATLRRLTKQEIDSRIGKLIAELTHVGNPEDSESMRPRSISPAELVDRMAKFIVFN
jgi:hypothetical protein